MVKKDIIQKWNDAGTSPFGPPDGSGVYGIYCLNLDYPHKKPHLLYIGCSKHIHKRVMNPQHIYRKAFSHFKFPFCSYGKYMECDNYAEAEKILIKHFKPLLNKIGK